MQSTLSTVEEYIASLSLGRADAISRIRSLCIDLLPDYEETMLYGMPTYLKSNIAEVAFNSQKNYISLYIMKRDILDVYRQHFKDTGKGCVRFKDPAKIEFSIIESILKDVAQSSAEVCSNHINKF